jgi:hypothetical protein
LLLSAVNLKVGRARRSLTLQIHRVLTRFGVSLKRYFALALLLLFCSGNKVWADTYHYVGSFQVDQGPGWSPAPTAYSGQEAAAVVFGGPAGQYAISTVSTSINHLAWYSIWGTGSAQKAEDFSLNTGGLYANEGDYSAYIRDWAHGSQFTNYVFSNAQGVSPVPEPGTLALLSTGIVGLAGATRRRRIL